LAQHATVSEAFLMSPRRVQLTGGAPAHQDPPVKTSSRLISGRDLSFRASRSRIIARQDRGLARNENVVSCSAGQHLHRVILRGMVMFSGRGSRYCPAVRLGKRFSLPDLFRDGQKQTAPAPNTRALISVRWWSPPRRRRRRSPAC
jgi:hypothetical protein